MKKYLNKLILLFIILINFNSFAQYNSSFNAFLSKGQFNQWNNTSDTKTVNTSFNPLTMSFSDSNQDIATYSIIELKMTQDNDNYYFKYKINYESPETTYNKNIRMASGEYQTIRNGQIYLSSIPIHELSYNYTLNNGSLFNKVKHFYNNNGSNQLTMDEEGNFSTFQKKGSITLSVNNNQYHSTQKNTETVSFNVERSSSDRGKIRYIQVSRNNSYTSDDSGVPENDFTNMIYSTINMPYNNHSSYIYNLSMTTVPGGYSFSNPYYVNNLINGSWISLYYHDVVGYSPLFNGGQNDYTNFQNNGSIVNDTYSITNDNNLINEDNNHYWNNTFEGKFTVPKNLIDNYRYLNMYAPEAIYTSINTPINSYDSSIYTHNASNYSNNQVAIVKVNHSEVSKSVHSDGGIDLKEYIYCNHEWYFFEKPQGDKINHIKKCRHCEWEIEEPHEMIYEYDGHTNNLCSICGYTDRIKLNIYEDETTPIQSGIELRSFTHLPANFKTILDSYIKDKTGYYLNGYSYGNLLLPKQPYSSTHTELEESDIKFKYDEFPELVASKSSTLRLNYEPNEYYIELQSESNLGTMLFVSGERLGPYYYDIDYPIPNPGQVGGSYFKGWSLTKKSTADYTTTFRNLTATRSEIVKLWPVLRDQEFIFKFHNYSNYGHELATISDVTFTAHDPISLLPNNIEIPGYRFLGWSLTRPATHEENGRQVPDNFNIDFIPNANVTGYSLVDKAEFLVYPIYQPITYKVSFAQYDITNYTVVATNSITCEYDREYKLTDYNNLHQATPNYYLVGYSYNDNGALNTLDIDINGTFKNLAITQDQEITLYPLLSQRSYKVKFRPENNLRIPLTITSNYDNDRCWYNVNYPAPYFIAGTDYPQQYNQIGWTLTQGSSNIDINSATGFINLSNIQDQEVYIYPVFEAYRYNINYNYYDNQLLATRSVLERAEVGQTKDLMTIVMVPMKDALNYGWYIQMPERNITNIRVKNTSEIDQYVNSENDTINIEWQLIINEDGTSSIGGSATTVQDDTEPVILDDFLNYDFYVNIGDNKGLYKFKVRDIISDENTLQKNNLDIIYDKTPPINKTWDAGWKVADPNNVHLYDGQPLRIASESNIIH